MRPASRSVPLLVKASRIRFSRMILPQESDYRIEAEARADGEQIAVHYGTAAGPAVPETIIRYVMRTQ
jgi:hypothetical protein